MGMTYPSTDVTNNWPITVQCLGAAEVAQWVKCLWCRHEDGRSDPQNSFKCWVSMAACRKSQDKELETRDPWGKLVS